MKKKHMCRSSECVILLLLLIWSTLFISSCTHEVYVYQIPEMIDDGLITAAANDVGLDHSTLGEAVNRIRDKTYNEVHSMLIVKNSRLVLEEYFTGHKYKWDGPNHHGKKVKFDRDMIHNLASVTKSFTSAIVGIAVDHGYIKSVDEKVLSFFPEYSHLSDENKEKITIEHLLTMTSGLEWNEWEYPYSDTRNDIIQLHMVSDPFEYILSKPVIHESGTEWYYSGADVNLLAEIIKRASGMRMDIFADKYLFEPMGIEKQQWQFIKPDIVYASGDLKLRPKDMAKFGMLYLQGGLYDGTRIISKEWIDRSITKLVKLDKPVDCGSDGYGYQWFFKTYTVNSRQVEVVRRTGWGGQAIILFPELDMLAVFTGGTYTSMYCFDDILTRYILPTALMNAKQE